MAIITPEFITEVKRLQLEGLSQRAIARKLKVSKITIVRALHNGYDISLRASKAPVTFIRCPDCGGKQRTDEPCRVCSTRKQQENQRAIGEFNQWFSAITS